MAIDIGSMGLIVILENLSPFLPVYVRLFNGFFCFGKGVKVLLTSASSLCNSKLRESPTQMDDAAGELGL